MKPCSPKCLKMTSLSEPGGPRIMINPVGNEKFPIAHTPHGQCLDCQRSDYEQALEQIARQFPNSEEALWARFKKLKAKVEHGK